MGVFSLGSIGNPCCCSGGGTFTCSAYGIPTQDLTVVENIAGGALIYTHTMTYNSVTPTWTYSGGSTGLDDNNCQLNCIFCPTTNTPNFRLTTPGPTPCGNCVGPAGMTLTSYTASPFKLVYSLAVGSPCSTNFTGGNPATYTLTL